MENNGTLGIVRLEYRKRPVNPDRKPIEKIPLGLCELLIADIYDVFRLVLAKDEIFSVRIRLQKDLRQNKDRILQPIIPIIPHISDGDLAIHRLKGTFPQDLVNRSRRILIPLDDNLHGLGLLVVIGIINALHEHLTIIDLVRQHTIQKPL